MQHTASFNDAYQSLEYYIRLCQYADLPEHSGTCFPIKRLALEDGIPSVSKEGKRDSLSPDHSSSPNHLLTNLISEVARTVILIVEPCAQRSLPSRNDDEMLT